MNIKINIKFQNKLQQIFSSQITKAQKSSHFMIFFYFKTKTENSIYQENKKYIANRVGEGENYKMNALNESSKPPML